MTNETPQVPLTTPPPSYYPEIPQRPEKSLIRVISEIILAIILIIFIGGGVSLAARIWDPLWNPFRPEPEKMIEKMSKRMEELKTFHSEIKIDFEAKSEEGEEKGYDFKMAILTGTDIDNTDSQNPKSAGNFEATINLAGMQFFLTGENKTIGKESYLKLTTIPALPFLQPFFQLMGINLSALEGQWIKTDRESAKSLLESLGIPITPEMEEETKEGEAKEEETIERLQALLRDKKLYIVKEEYPDEKIRGVSNYHYLVALNKEEIKNLLPELFKTIRDYTAGTSPIPFDEEEFEKGLEETLPKLDEFFEKIGEITAEIWIGKKDNYLYKIKAEKEIDLSQFEEAAETAKGTIIIKVDIDFSNLNQPVKIEVPKDFKTFEEIILPMISP